MVTGLFSEAAMQGDTKEDESKTTRRERVAVFIVFKPISCDKANYRQHFAVLTDFFSGE
ncbi:hypothetical protein N480_17040 [Pseudoalteromonas luteoviolacea S2607]|nr:hypothetical protein N480_17040 [Pseudoalteromonas luteoviolacea S2607]